MAVKKVEIIQAYIIVHYIKASPRTLGTKNRMRVTICLVLSFTLAKDHLSHNSVSRLLNDESSNEKVEFPEQKEFHQVKIEKKIFLLKKFKKSKNYIDNCVETSAEPYKDCYNDLFNSDYFWS